MSWTSPTASDFKTFFLRDFNFASPSDSKNTDFIMDSDISRAIVEAEVHFNSGLFASESQATNTFMYLVAFCLVRNLQNSAKGISSQSKFPISNTSVGGVSVGFSIPEPYLKDPVLSSYTQNGYGMRYLELVLPFCVGNIGIIEGGTTWD